MGRSPSRSPAGPATSDTRSERRVVGYYAGWTAKEKGFTPADIPAHLLTHINYAFGLIGPDCHAVLGDAAADIGHAVLPESQRPDDLGGNFRDLKMLKVRHSHLKTLISIGGWTGSGRFSDAVTTAQRRRDFASSCIELFLIRWPGVFDGIDIDWEYPVCCGLPENAYRPEDKRNFTLLIEELRRQLDDLGRTTGQQYLLTAALPAGRDQPTISFELRQCAEILDWINVMTYDMSGSNDSGFTNFNAPLGESDGDPTPDAARRYRNVAGTIRAFEEEGVPPDRLVVGVPFYGRGFTGVPALGDGLYQPFTGTMGANYRTIAAEYLPTWKRFWHQRAEVPWLYDIEGHRMMSYDDPESIARKASYVRDRGLGGVMIWELSDDDERSSLLTAIQAHLHPPNDQRG